MPFVIRCFSNVLWQLEVHFDRLDMFLLKEHTEIILLDNSSTKLCINYSLFNHYPVTVFGILDLEHFAIVVINKVAAVLKLALAVHAEIVQPVPFPIAYTLVTVITNQNRSQGSVPEYDIMVHHDVMHVAGDRTRSIIQ